MTSHPLIAFCRSRQALKDETQRIRETLDETADAKRVAMAALRDNMERHAVDCLCMEAGGGSGGGGGGGSGSAVYARLAEAPHRYPPIRTFDDVRQHAADMGVHIRDVPTLDVPPHVLRLFLDRVRLPAGQKRVTLHSTLPQRITPRVDPPAEVRVVARSLNVALGEHRECRQTLKTLGQTVREASKAVETTLAPDRPVTVEMHRSNGGRKTVEITRATRTPSNRGIGVRKLSEAVKEAARFAVHDRDNFDAHFASQLATLLGKAAPPAEKVHLRVRERRRVA